MPLEHPPCQWLCNYKRMLPSGTSLHQHCGLAKDQEQLSSFWFWSLHCRIPLLKQAFTLSMVNPKKQNPTIRHLFTPTLWTCQGPRTMELSNFWFWSLNHRIPLLKQPSTLSMVISKKQNSTIRHLFALTLRTCQWPKAMESSNFWLWSLHHRIPLLIQVSTLSMVIPQKAESYHQAPLLHQHHGLAKQGLKATGNPSISHSQGYIAEI